MGKITENGLKILEEKRYFKSGEKTWDDLVKRVAKTISQGEMDYTNSGLVKKCEDELIEAMGTMKFIFSSPCLINSDPINPGQYSSCFIIDIKDTIESVFEAVAKMAKIFQKSGGVGIANISVLRPNGSRVEKSNGYSCGPTYFMKVYNEAATAMTVSNYSKRGAIKINMDMWHPDIYDFINLKANAAQSEFNLMNISVSLSDKFMRAVENDSMWDLVFPDYEKMDKEIYNENWNGDLDDWKGKGYPVKVYKSVKARELKRFIDEAAWKIGDPGFNYQDTMDRANTNKHLGKKIYTNPCNEFSNLPWTSCNLGSINLVEFIKMNNTFDFNEFSEYVKKAVRWLDNMVNVNKLPLPEIQQMTEDIRPIGLGVMGFASALYKLGIGYGNNEECINFIHELMEIMMTSSIEESTDLALIRGVYPKWAGSEWEKLNIKIRNSNLISIAPNGTLSALAGVSGGIEPEFALSYYRKTNNENTYFYTNPMFEEELKKRGLFNDDILKKVTENHGSCVGIDEIPMDMQKIFVTSHDIAPKDHVYVVAKFQKFVDLSISKTINFNNNATIEDISSIIELGWKTGCKGLTIYRDGCRVGQTLSTSLEEEPKEAIIQEVITRKSRKDFGRKLVGNTYSANSGCGTFYFTLNKNPENGDIVETFVNIKQGLCKSNVDALNRMISLSLRQGINIEDVIDQLKGITCSACKGDRAKDGLSCPDAMARILRLEADSDHYNNIIEIVQDEKIVKDDIPYSIEDALKKNVCPECKAKLEHVSGCIQCYNCGWSKC